MMYSEYVRARHHRMVIRIVEPAQFIRRTVAERRPVSFVGDIELAEEKPQIAPALFSIVISALILAALAYCVTYGLDAFLRAWLP